MAEWHDEIRIGRNSGVFRGRIPIHAPVFPSSGREIRNKRNAGTAAASSVVDLWKFIHRDQAKLTERKPVVDGRWSLLHYPARNSADRDPTVFHFNTYSIHGENWLRQDFELAADGLPSLLCLAPSVLPKSAEGYSPWNIP